MARKKGPKIVEEGRKSLGNIIDNRYKVPMDGVIAKQTGKHKKRRAL